MRVWHKDLLDVLPRQQLLGQWQECCLVAKYLKQCLYNLQEKYDCGGISDEEWLKIIRKYPEMK